MARARDVSHHQNLRSISITAKSFADRPSLPFRVATYVALTGVRCGALKSAGRY
jgi:hypothetical protein